jgi:phage terminase small subunit
LSRLDLPRPLRRLISLSGYAKEEWVRVSPELFAIGLLTDLDTATLAAYCWACGVWHDPTQALDRMAELDPKMKGLLVKGDGGPVQNPLIREACCRPRCVRSAALF